MNTQSVINAVQEMHKRNYIERLKRGYTILVGRKGNAKQTLSEYLGIKLEWRDVDFGISYFIDKRDRSTHIKCNPWVLDFDEQYIDNLHDDGEIWLSSETFDSPLNPGCMEEITWKHPFYELYDTNLDREGGWAINCDDKDIWCLDEYYIDTGDLPKQGYICTDGEYRGEKKLKWMQFRLLFEYWAYDN